MIELEGRRFITEKDLFTFTWIADPQISPDGRQLSWLAPDAAVVPGE